MRTFRIMIGAPASGKSSAAKRIREYQNDFVICPDLIRGVHPTWSQKKVFGCAFQRLFDATGRGRSILLDSTAANVLHRIQAIKFGRSRECRVIGIWLDTPLEMCIQRHQQRSALVSQVTLTPEIISAYHGWLTKCPPTLSEGFDELHRILPEDDIVATLGLNN